MSREMEHIAEQLFLLAGAGRMGSGTQYTVNNQMVNATLMNIADSPTNVQLPGVYKVEEIPRVPIICTGALCYYRVKSLSLSKCGIIFDHTFNVWAVGTLASFLS